MSLRALGRFRRAHEPEAPDAGAEFAAARCDSWLSHFQGDDLEWIDAACADGSPERFALFRKLDADLWGLLLTQQYELYPNIRALLPDVPDPATQQMYNGLSGLALSGQSVAFYSKLCARLERHLGHPLAEASLVDFGCGWGRLTRFLARDVAPGRLHGCDPVEQILGVCRAHRVPANLARSEVLPERLPFDERFDAAFAFSVFTHLSEAAHLSCLQALHAGLRPGGILVLTVRPPHYLELNDLMRPTLESLGPDWRRALQDPRYLFVPHPASDDHPQNGGCEMHFGEAVITMPYVREHWAPLFELLEIDFLMGDLHQVMLTMRRR
jgi:SAM-dependent methyltransferase